MKDIILTCIGDVLFHTESSIRLRPMRARGFPLFICEQGKPDVYHFFHGVTEKSLNMPPLDLTEKKYISNYTIRKIINRSYTIFPLVKYYSQNSQNNFIYSAIVSDFFDVPLLRSELVRERLFNKDNDPSQIVLVLHGFTIEVYDYKSHRIDVFYPKVMHHNLQLIEMESSIGRMFRTFLSHFDAFIVHSAAVVRNGKAAMFLAQSGGGKTTVTRQASINDVLGDDHIMLRKQNGEIFAHSTPWNRITSGPVSAPLGAIFLLEKSDLFELNPIKPIEVIEFLWNEHIYFTDKLPKHSRIQAFNFLCEIVNRTPLYRMRTPLNGVNWAAIDACL
jgi:hypothetical protein